jgi:hypothetical protein
MGKASKLKEIFSGVPQGARWSPGIWNFDIHDLPDFVLHGEIFSYADDCTLWYVVTDENRDTIIDQINEDLESVRLWGVGNKTDFEPTKTYSLLVTGKGRGRGTKFDISGIKFCDTTVEQVKELKIVGYIFEEEMTWGSMVRKLAKKGRSRLAALFRMKHALDPVNMEIMYKAFVRSVIEYGNVAHMAAGATYLKKLDSIQEPMSEGSMLDHTRVLFGSGMGYGGTHSNRNLPVFVAGGGFKHLGHFDARDASGNNMPLCNLFVTLMQRFGLERETFNTSTGSLDLGLA